MNKILISGGTGTFGNALVRRLLSLTTGGPSRIVIYSRDEQKQDVMAREFDDSERMRFFIGDIRDIDRLTMAMKGVDTVFHAAALKVVPIGEYNPFEFVGTNVIGAENIVRASLQAGVRRVVALSTDKCVSPINLYGATKLCAEKIFMAAHALAAGDCLYSVVRYGNVVGSRGSVVPLFRKLAAQGKRLPLTDARMTRFWLTIDQAVDFVLSSMGRMQGREVFVPKIPSIRIIDLVTAMSKMEPEIIGIRPGEKLHETLLTEDEAPYTTIESDRFIIRKDMSGTVPDPFRYSSDTNNVWLSAEQLRGML